MGSVVLSSYAENCEPARLSGVYKDRIFQEESAISIPIHPLSIKPIGNQYVAPSNARHAIAAFQLLPDEVISILLECFDPSLLITLGSTCKFMYAFCHAEELWKSLFIESAQSKTGAFHWRGSWRSTLLGLEASQVSHVSCDNVFSDVLHRPFLYAHTSLIPFATGIPVENSIARFENISAAEFSATWSDKPFILTRTVSEWPVYKSWNSSMLLQDYGNIQFRAEAVDWPLKTYYEYMQNNNDESPLYLFDRSFVEKMNLRTGSQQHGASYWIPDCFGEDLFAVLGNKRPDDKWLIIGPARSGSTYHKDPNATSAWNAVIRGSKYWIMFPSDDSSPPPPGVYVSEDQSEVTSPLTIAEWLIAYHAEARRVPGCMEGICSEGEVLHVPSGWWHLVVNLEESIAITQNFVPRSHLCVVLSFLRDKPDQVSGFQKEVSDPYRAFVEGMEREHPELLLQALEDLEMKAKGKKRKWDEAKTAENERDSGGFSFGFGGDSDTEIP